MDLENFFGVNVRSQFEAYVDSPEFDAWLKANTNGSDPVSFAVLENRQRDDWHWTAPLRNCTFRYVVSGYVGKGMEPDGTMENVERKLRFVLRTGLNSVEARTRPDLIQPGDFPHEGAGTYRGYTGGVSGRKAPEDWRIFCHLVDKLIELLGTVGTKVLNKCDELRKDPNALVGTKYLPPFTLYPAT